MASYPVGDVVRLSVVYKSSNVATDPTTVTLKIKYPNSANANDLTLTTFVYGSSSIVKDSTGNYHYDYTTTVSGTHYYRWEGGGTVVAADESSFVAGPSHFA